MRLQTFESNKERKFGDFHTVSVVCVGGTVRILFVGSEDKTPFFCREAFLSSPVPFQVLFPFVLGDS